MQRLGTLHSSRHPRGPCGQAEPNAAADGAHRRSRYRCRHQSAVGRSARGRRRVRGNGGERIRHHAGTGGVGPTKVSMLLVNTIASYERWQRQTFTPQLQTPSLERVAAQ
jgi:hypothetical protein